MGLGVDFDWWLEADEAFRLTEDMRGNSQPADETVIRGAVQLFISLSSISVKKNDSYNRASV